MSYTLIAQYEWEPPETPVQVNVSTYTKMIKHTLVVILHTAEISLL